MTSCPRLRVAAVGILTVFVAVATLNYPLFATGGRLEQRMNASPEHLTLDGLSWMRGGMIHNRAGEEITFTGDYDAIMWLREHASGNAIILEAEIGAFVGGGSRVSAYTGLPSVLGWGGHQNIQRSPQRVFQRAVDVREFYRTPDVDRKRFLLRKYRVDYVIVGDVERLTILPNAPDPATGQIEYYAGEDGILAIDQMDGSDLELVFESNGTSVYRVLPFERASNGR
jgi:uncharacterized membrane protein